MVGLKMKSERSGKCPYWSLESPKECGVTKGGMYIPMPEHVRVFCLSEKYYKCRHFVKSCDLMKAQDGSLVSAFLDAMDRRRLQRYPEQLCFDLVVCNRDKLPQKMNAYKARSLDVSLGGLRLESYNEFAEGSIVSFVMDPEFSFVELLGVGDVKWCRFKQDSNKFESGVAFSNYSTSERVREYLEL